MEKDFLSRTLLIICPWGYCGQILKTNHLIYSASENQEAESLSRRFVSSIKSRLFLKSLLKFLKLEHSWLISLLLLIDL